MTVSAAESGEVYKVVFAPRHKSKCLVIMRAISEFYFKLATEFEQYLINLNKKIVKIPPKTENPKKFIHPEIKSLKNVCSYRIYTKMSAIIIQWGVIEIYTRKFSR